MQIIHIMYYFAVTKKQKTLKHKNIKIQKKLINQNLKKKKKDNYNKKYNEKLQKKTQTINIT